MMKKKKKGQSTKQETFFSGERQETQGVSIGRNNLSSLRSKAETFGWLFLSLTGTVCFGSHKERKESNCEKKYDRICKEGVCWSRRKCSEGENENDCHYYCRRGKAK